MSVGSRWVSAGTRVQGCRGTEPLPQRLWLGATRLLSLAMLIHFSRATVPSHTFCLWLTRSLKHFVY